MKGPVVGHGCLFLQLTENEFKGMSRHVPIAYTYLSSYM